MLVVPHTCEHLIFYKEGKKYVIEKREHHQQLMLIKLDGCMQQSENSHIFISLHETQLQTGQGPQQKARYTDYERPKSEEQA